MIIWRGLGVLVAVIFFISGWLNSYRFEDTTLGNGDFMGWSMIWAAAPTLLLWIALRKFNTREKELAPGEIAEEPSKFFTGHSFMFIPVVFWPWIFAGLGLYFVSGSSSSSDSDYADQIEDLPDADTGELLINFWNPNEETIEIYTYYAYDNSERMHEEIDPNGITYATYEANDYSFEYLNFEKDVTVEGAKELDTNSYNQAWFLLNDVLDLLLVDVSLVCNTDVNRDDIRSIDWAKKVKERYEGGGLITPELDASGTDMKYTVTYPGRTIPTKIGENEKIYTFIPIHYKTETNDAYLDSMIIDLCY